MVCQEGIKSKTHLSEWDFESSCCQRELLILVFDYVEFPMNIVYVIRGT